MSRSVATGLVFVFSAVVLVLLMDRTIDIFDEGLVLTNAMRTLVGDVDHRDYYSPYGPASFYAFAAAFRLSDYPFLAARLVGVSVMAGLCATTFHTLFTRTRPWICLVFTGLVGAWLVASPKYLYPLFPCLLLALIGTLLVLHSLTRPKASALFWAGCCTGAAALFRYDGGFYLLLAHVAAMAVLILSDRTRKGAAARLVRAMAIYGAGVALVFLPAAIAFAATGSIAGFVADIVDYPLHYYGAMRRLPFPGLATVLRSPSEAGVYLPVVATAFAAFRLSTLGVRLADDGAQKTGDEARFLVLFTILTVAFFCKGLVRVSPLHMMMAIVPANLLLAVLVERWLCPGAHRVAAVIALAAAIIPSAAAARRELAASVREPTRTFAGLAALAIGSGGAATPPDGCSSSPAAKGSRNPPDYRAVVTYLRRYSAPQERIFVGLNRHDRIFVNSVGLYFLAGRLPGTHWHQFDPGLQTRRDIQQAIIADLQRNRVRWVVRDASFDHVIEPNESRRSSGVYDLDNYLASNFRPVARAGLVEIWLSTASPAPPQIGQGACLPKPVISATP